MPRHPSKCYAKSSFSKFKESVLVRAPMTDGAAAIDIPCNAVVLDFDAFDASIATGGNHTVAGDSWTVQIARADWPSAVPPAFGARVTLLDEDGKTLTVQGVQNSRDVITLACVGKMAEGDR